MIEQEDALGGAEGAGRRELTDEEYRSLKKVLAGTAGSIYLTNDRWQKLTGIRASFLRVPFVRDNDVRKEITRPIPPPVERLLKGQPRAVFGDETRTVFETLGFWDWVTLDYLDDFYYMTQAETLDFHGIQGYKSFYGYVLATNSGVEGGEIGQRPFASHTSTTGRGVFSHFKLNPLLLFAGRSDLVLHTAQFIALLLSAPDEFWHSSGVQKAWRLVIEKITSGNPQVNVGLAKEVYQAADKAVQRALELRKGVEYLVYRNLEWNDLSLYLMGPSLENLAELAMLFREMPVLFPRMVSKVKALLRSKGKKLDEPPDEHLPLGGLLEHGEAKAAELQMARLIDHCKNLAEKRQPKSWPHPAESYLPELAVFCDYTDVFVLPAVEEPPQPGVRYFHKMNVKPTRVGELREQLPPDGRDRSELKLISGPVDLVQESSRPPEGAPDPRVWELLYSRDTQAMIELEPTSLYRRLLERGSLFEIIGPLLARQTFGFDEWVELEALLREAGAARVVRRSMKNIVLQHLAYKNDPFMVNTLYGYLQVWSNVSALVRENVERQKALRDDGRLDEVERARGTLLCNLQAFVERVGVAINARYHSSTRMFEVVDLTPHHKGGVDAFLQAYSEVMQLALDCCSHIDADSHRGFVKVGEGPTTVIRPLFGSIIEIDWLKLMTPESAMIVLHEMGHQILRDRALNWYRSSLGEPGYWWSVTRVVADFNTAYLETIPEEEERASALLDWTRLEEIGRFFEDVFCDLLMMTVLSQSIGRDELQRLVGLYDRHFWAQAEMQLASGGSIPPSYVHLLLVRWACVRRSLTRCLVEPQTTDRGEALLTAVRQIVSSAAEPGAETDFDFERLTADATAWAKEIELMPVPTVEEWKRTLAEAAALSPGVRRLVEPPDASCGSCNGTCKQTDEGRCTKFACDSLAVVFGYFRPLEAGSAGQLALALANVILKVVVSSTGGEAAATEKRRPFRLLFELADLLYDRTFRGAAPASSYATFDDDGFVAKADYQDVVVNPRGSLLVLDANLRQVVLDKRLELLNCLAEARFERVAEELIPRRVQEGGAGG